MPGRLLTSAMPYTPLGGYFDYAALNETLDIFALMAYDMNSDDAVGDVSGPGSRLNLILKGIESYRKLGVPPSKLMVTLGWYGDDFVCNASGWNSSGWPRHDRCVLAYPPSGPCAPTCIDGGPKAGGLCISNCTQDIGYGQAKDLHDWLEASGARVSDWIVGDDGVSPFFQYISPTDGRRHQVWVDGPAALSKKVSAIAETGVRGTGMWTANAFHRRDPALSAKAAAEMFGAMRPRGGGGYGGLGFSPTPSPASVKSMAKTTDTAESTSRRVMVWIDTKPSGVNGTITELISKNAEGRAVTGICVAGFCTVTDDGALLCNSKTASAVPRIAAAGLEGQALISCGNVTCLRGLFDHADDFIASALRLASSMNIRGYNLDFEVHDKASDGNVTTADVTSWVSFCNKFADALHGEGRILTMYTGVGSEIGGNLPLLASTRIDRFQTGDTYTATYSEHSESWFRSALLCECKAFSGIPYATV